MTLGICNFYWEILSLFKWFCGKFHIQNSLRLFGPLYVTTVANFDITTQSGLENLWVGTGCAVE